MTAVLVGAAGLAVGYAASCVIVPLLRIAADLIEDLL